MSLQRHLRLVTDAKSGVQAMHTLRIAFATTDMKRVDQHFGSAQSFAIYAVDERRATLQERAQFGKDLAQDGNEDKLVSKLKILNGCSAVYCQAAGASAVRQLLGIEVQPIKVPAGSEIATLIETLQQELRNGPTGWLARAVSAVEEKTAPQSDSDRFAAMANESWTE